jgi:hypothetical protein
VEQLKRLGELLYIVLYYIALSMREAHPQSPGNSEVAD